MYCPECGFQNGENVEFCGSCGAAMNRGKKRTDKKRSAGKKRLIAVISVLMIVAVAAVALVVSFFLKASNEKELCVYARDNQLMVYYPDSKKTMVIDEELIQDYSMFDEDYVELAHSNTINSILVSADGRIVYKGNGREGKPLVDQTHKCMKVSGDEAKEIALPLQIREGYQLKLVQQENAIYSVYNNNLYKFDFKTIEKLESNVSHTYYSKEAGRVLFVTRKQDGFSDFYEIGKNGKKSLIANEVVVFYSDEERDIYAYHNKSDDIFTYIKGEAIELKNIPVGPDELETRDSYIKYCTQDGTLLKHASIRQENTPDGDRSYRIEGTFYFKNGETETFSDFGEISEDGTVFCTLEKDAGKEEGILSKYRLEASGTVLLENYEDVCDFEITKDNDLLIFRDATMYEDHGILDMYLNNKFIASDVVIRHYRADNTYHKFEEIEAVDKNYIIYPTDLREKENSYMTYTLNVYDGSGIVKVDEDLGGYPVVTEDNKMLYIKGKSLESDKGELKILDGTKAEVISRNVYHFYPEYDD